MFNEFASFVLCVTLLFSLNMRLAYCNALACSEGCFRSVRSLILVGVVSGLQLEALRHLHLFRHKLLREKKMLPKNPSASSSCT
mmetsp:Transcript_4297/g.9290  ORF Transcript_4297/g.9290 Transcript_4297/m.9290 type:complete len:84 (+) Transcript_4297:425-676(+)